MKIHYKKYKFTKIYAYLNELEKHGLALNEPYIKKIDSEIWELRPLKDRLLFASWNGNEFIILSHFIKKLKKHLYLKLIKLKDILKTILKGVSNMSKYKTWKEVKKDFNLTDEEKIEIDLEIQLIEAAIEARQKANVTQRELSNLTGIKQPSIAKIENLTHSPQASTLIKLLYPIGYTLKIVPLDKKYIKDKKTRKEAVM